MRLPSEISISIPDMLDFSRFLWRKMFHLFIIKPRRSYGYASVCFFDKNHFSHHNLCRQSGIEPAKPKRPRYNKGNCIFIILFLLVAAMGLDAQNPARNSFLWPESARNQARQDLFTRSKGRALLEIPAPGTPIQFYISPNSYIRSGQFVDGDIYQSFSGRDSIGDPVFGYYYRAQIRLSYYKNGQVITVAPVSTEKELYTITSTADPEALGEIICDAEEIPGLKVRNGGRSVHCQTQNFSTRTFELFVACTGEWGAKLGSLSAVRNAINAHVTELNALYDGELNVYFNLITEDEFLYTDKNTDPFNTNASSLANEARNFFATYVTTPFDIGHVFHYLGPSSGTRGSGVAYVNSICNDFYKGGGWTGTSSPGNVDFNMQIFGHEIGHQMGADHSFYGNKGNCSGNQRSKGSGFEPGAGSTLMSYEAQCGTDNLDGPRSSTLYLNTHSVSQILSTINSQSSCGSKMGRGNHLSIQIPRNFSVPKHTAFDLIATGGNSAQSYIWEQYDTDSQVPSDAKASPLNAGKYTTTPMYRSYDPSPGGNHRSFPSKDVQSTGKPKRGEVYADVARDITMRLMTRSGGSIRCDEMTVTVRDAPPFKIESPLKNDLIALAKSTTRASDKMAVRWETGDTENNGFPTIDIWYSLDGGKTYPYLLADNVPNDGEHLVRPPEVNTDQARLKIELSDGTGRMSIYHENQGNFSVAFSILPIEIAEFNGRVNEDHHTLSWVLNNTGEYIRAVNLEYSYDGITFNPVALPDFEQLNTESQWIDEYQSYFIGGLKTYYRLAIENGAERKTYSSIVALRNERAADRFVDIHPNPVVSQEAQLVLQNYLQPNARISIRSISGQKMWETRSIPHTKNLSIPFSFPNGVYIVEVDNGNEIFHEKVIVQGR